MELGEAVRILIVIVLVLVPILSQVLAKIRNAKMPPPPAGGPEPAPRPRQEDFQQEIGDFLRRATEGREARPPAQGRPAQPPRRRPAAPPPVPQAAKPGELAPVGGSVFEHVKKYIDTSDFGRRTAQLGEEVALADDKVDARLHEVFEHQLSQFDWRTPDEIEAAGGQPAATAAGIALLLANPESLRQAIVLNEILQRPVQRWA